MQDKTKTVMDALRKPKLQNICTKYGLPVGGMKEDLKGRIRQWEKDTGT